MLAEKTGKIIRILKLQKVGALLLISAVLKFLPETIKPDSTVSLRVKSIWPGYLSVLKNRSFLVYTLAGGISYAGMYAYIAGENFSVADQRDKEPIGKVAEQG